MAYGTRRRRSTRRTFRSRAPSRRYSSRRASSYRRPVRRRRSYARSSRGGQRTVRVVIQTVAASPLTLGMKGLQPVRRMF